MISKGFENNILMQADDFCEAFYRCYRGENSYEEGSTIISHSVNIPAIVNAAFACELYMKAIINKEFKQHNLFAMYNRLPKIIIIEIEDKYFQNNISEYKTAKDAIFAVKNTFVEWRYLYKEDYNDQCNAKDLNSFLRIFLSLVPVLKEVSHSHYK